MVVASPLAIPIGQFVKYLQDGVWHHLSVVSALQWLTENALQRGLFDPDALLHLQEWSSAPTSWVGLHAILSWVPLVLAVFVFFGFLFGALAVYLFVTAENVRPVILDLNGAGKLVATRWRLIQSGCAWFDQVPVPFEFHALFYHLTELYRLLCFYLPAAIEFGVDAAQDMVLAQGKALRELDGDDIGDGVYLATMIEHLSFRVIDHSLLVEEAIDDQNLEEVLNSSLRLKTSDELARFLLAVYPGSPFENGEAQDDREKLNELDFEGLDALLAKCLDYERASVVSAFLELLQDVKQPAEWAKVVRSLYSKHGRES